MIIPFPNQCGILFTLLTMHPHGVTKEQLNLRAFPFSLKDDAKDWLYFLPPGSITTWPKMEKKFLEKLFPTSSATKVRKNIH